MYSIAKYDLLDSDAFLGTETENIEGKIRLEGKKNVLMLMQPKAMPYSFAVHGPDSRTVVVP